MTATERAELHEAMSDGARRRARPLPGDGTGSGTAELSESKSGWTLTLSLDARTAVALRESLSQAGRSQLELRGFAVSITPNLVPGEPFPLESVDLVIAEDELVTKVDPASAG
jgi:hypothetical protein